MGYPRKTGLVRFVPGAGFEMQCGACHLYVSLHEEEWQPRNGLSWCRSCWREYARLKQAGYRRDGAVTELGRTRAKLRYAFDRERMLARKAAWRAANRERVAEYNRQYRAARKAA